MSATLTMTKKSEKFHACPHVILSPEDLAELEETLSVLSDPQALADIREADVAYAAGDIVRGVDAVRGLRS